MGAPFQITVDCVNAERMAEFWALALGYVPKPPPEGFESWPDFAEAARIVPPEPGALASIVDPNGIGPTIKFVGALGAPRGDLGFNFELRPGGDDAKVTLVEALIEHGAREIRRHREPAGWWSVMSDPEGNEFCVL